MEWSDDDSHSSSNTSDTSNSTSNGPSNPVQENENESNEQTEAQNNVQHHQRERSRSSSPESNSMQDKQDSNQENQSMSPQIHEQNEENQQQQQQQLTKEDDNDDEELELSDIDEESNNQKKADISHEDLSDISDLDDSNGPTENNFTDLRQKLDKRRQNGGSSIGELDELDFEADEVKENAEQAAKKVQEPKESSGNGNGSANEDGEHKSENELESGEELEEGEVTDGDEKRPEESEPKAVCRFFTRGQCTWGMSCRFLHPGTTDKGNYTMFDLVRPIPVPQAAPMIMPSYDYRNERPIHHMPPHVFPSRGPPPPAAAENESAWERGLKTAKEMMRKANKRKEQDMDFDEKKMNLSGPPDEIERDPYYARGSPENVFDRNVPPRSSGPRGYDYSPPHKFARTTPGFYEEDQYGRMARPYRELPAHRMPHYEDEEIGKRRQVRATREVIVEKASDDWNDPWMRKTHGRGGDKERKGRGAGGARERSYSSNSSYSSSSSSSRSRSRSSSESSPSPSRHRRFDAKRSKERATSRKVERPKSRSTSRRHSPSRRITKKAISPPLAIPKRKRPVSPPVRAEKVLHSRKKRDSSSSSGSDSDSSYSSSTSSSKGKRKREKLVSERKPVAVKKVEMTKKRTTTPPPVTKDDEKDKEKFEKASAAAKMKSSRRDELLAQLKAVEEAIARKRSKVK